MHFKSLKLFENSTPSKKILFILFKKGPKGLVNDQLTLEKFNQLCLRNEPEEDILQDDRTSGKECSGEGLCSEGGSCKSSSKRSSDLDWKSVLCYNCSHLLQDPRQFPNFLKESAMKNIRHKQMKDEIQDFLL